MRGPLVLLCLVLTHPSAHAQPAPITDRDYALDLYTGAAVGSVRIVGMGGTTIAVSEGTSGALLNPAAAAVRRTTSQGSWDWDFHIDYLSSVQSCDFENDGYPCDAGAASTDLVTAGLAGMLEGWGLAVVGTTITADVGGVEATTSNAKIALARELLDQEWTVGAGVRLGSFAIVDQGQTIFSIVGSGLELGALWRPRLGDLRVGASVALPVGGDDPDIDCEGDVECRGHIPPGRVVVPWHVAAGVAWRIAPSRWNQQWLAHYRDERAILLAADVIVTGAVDDGHGLEGFAYGELQPSGRSTVVSVRAGVEYEWLPGRLRLRGGSYWEPGRFEGVGGRLHATVGAELALFQFRFWKWWFRPRVALTGDVAERYANGGFSVGFWH